MHSFTFAVFFLAGILAHSNALPQYGLGEALIELAKELAKEDRNSTIRFGNNTVIITGVAHANANISPNPTKEPERRPSWPNQQNGWNYGNWNYYPGFGFWRNTPETVESVEDNVYSNEAEIDAEEQDDIEEASLDAESEEHDQKFADSLSEEDDEEDENDI